jgi:hypothetical protein
MLHVANARGHDQGLAVRVGVPAAAGADVERDHDSGQPRRRVTPELCMQPRRAREVLPRQGDGGSGIATLQLDLGRCIGVRDRCDSNQDGDCGST